MLEILENVNINGFTRKMNKKKRIVRKGGLTNVTYKNISKKRRRYISDLYTTLLDSSWSYVVLLFASSFYGSWILFGGKNSKAKKLSSCTLLGREEGGRR